MKKPLTAVVMGSDSDYPVMKEAAEALKKFKVPYEVRILSAHRTPNEVAEFAASARKRGIRVIIAGAGGAAHLPGMIASYTELPVIGVPVPIGVMQGEDALYSIVQMPKGVPVATVAIGNAWNAGILAVQILGAGSDPLLDEIHHYKEKMRSEVLGKKL
jgi:phosphoribosylaminoimidazole carboxylase PurE protein